ncbi:MAG: hypothetical protein ACI8ZB_002907 [Desulforhopalus sp.]|jgi:hypothetical protein
MVQFLSCLLIVLLSSCTPHHYTTRDAGGVSLFLDAPKATEVSFASSIDSFQVRPAKKNSNGLWVMNDLVDHEFDYFYIVDGRVYVPDCRYKEKDDFGANNCIYQPN